MRKLSIFSVMLLCITTKSKIYCQEHVRILSTQVPVQFLKNEAGKKTTDIRMIKVKLEYWTDNKSSAKNTKFTFVVLSAAAATGAAPAIAMSAMEIEKSKFDTKHDTFEVNVPVTIKALTVFVPEFFTIGIKIPDVAAAPLEPSIGGSMGVSLQQDKVEDVVEKTPFGFTYLNAVNFDFKGTNGASYVGHLNVYKPDMYKSIGINCGIFKTDFSRQDSNLDGTHNYLTNVLIHPLDSVKIGNRFLRQYNQLAVVSKNVTWSFYLQPLIRVIYTPNFKLYAHLHFEFYIDKWNITSTLTNYQQDTTVINENNINAVINKVDTVNLFQKSITDPVVSYSSSTKLNFNFGVGFTMDAKLWEGGSLFVQSSIGRAFNYERPDSVDAKTLKYIITPNTRKNFWGHVSRIVLTQEVTPNMQVLVGVDIRGRLTKTPTYSNYIGVNLGLAGLKKLINGS